VFLAWHFTGEFANHVSDGSFAARGHRAVHTRFERLVRNVTDKRLLLPWIFSAGSLNVFDTHYRDDYSPPIQLRGKSLNARLESVIDVLWARNLQAVKKEHGSRAFIFDKVRQP